MHVKQICFRYCSRDNLCSEPLGACLCWPSTPTRQRVELRPCFVAGLHLIELEKPVAGLRFEELRLCFVDEQICSRLNLQWDFCAEHDVEKLRQWFEAPDRQFLKSLHVREVEHFR